MSKTTRLSGAIALVLVGIYSLIMMNSNGEAATWASVLLVAALAALFVATRSKKEAS